MQKIIKNKMVVHNYCLIIKKPEIAKPKFNSLWNGKVKIEQRKMLKAK